MTVSSGVKSLIALVVLAIIGVFGFVFLGVYNVAASVEHFGVTKSVLSTVKARSVAVRANEIQVPDLGGDEQVAAGAASYKAMCATCHGAPGVQPSFIGKGLNPSPPDLGHAAKEMSEAELFWVLKHGIKMTGMPAFGTTHADEELWPLVTFIKKLPSMDAETYSQLSASQDGHGHHGETDHSASELAPPAIDEADGEGGDHVHDEDVATEHAN